MGFQLPTMSYQSEIAGEAGIMKKEAVAARSLIHMQNADINLLEKTRNSWS